MARKTLQIGRNKVRMTKIITTIILLLVSTTILVKGTNIKPSLQTNKKEQISLTNKESDTKTQPMKENIIQTKDMILINKGNYLINPATIKVKKNINLIGLYQLKEELIFIKEEYKNYCQSLEEMDSKGNTETNWIVKENIELNYKREAKQYCGRIFSKFPEIRKKQDLIMAIKTINSSNKLFYSNTYFDTKTNTFRFTSDDEMVTEVSYIKTTKNGKDIAHYNDEIFKDHKLYYILQNNQIFIEFNYESKDELIICVLPDNTKPKDFMDICRENRRDITTIMENAEKIMEAIMPKKVIQKDIRIRALFDINFCISWCNQGKEDYELQEEQIRILNNNFQQLQHNAENQVELVSSLAEEINEWKRNTDMIHFHSHMRSEVIIRIQLISTYYEQIKLLFYMEELKTPKWNILKENEIKEIEQKLQIKLFDRNEAIEIQLKIIEKKLVIYYKIPIYQEAKIATRYEIKPYPIFQYKHKYEAIIETKNILITTYGAIQGIEKENTCDTRSKICHTNKPFIINKNTSNCIIKQLEKPDNSCKMKKSKNQDNFFLVTKIGIFYSTPKQKGTLINIVCKSKKITQEKQIIYGRGKIIPKENCILKTSNKIIIPYSAEKLNINTTDLFTEKLHKTKKYQFQYNPNEIQRNIKKIEIKKIPIIKKILNDWIIIGSIATIISITCLLICYKNTITNFNNNNEGNNNLPVIQIRESNQRQSIPMSDI